MIVTDLKILRQKSKNIRFWQRKKVFERLEKELRKVSGVGLSAIQIGIPLRAAIIRLPNISINLFNPTIIRQENEFLFAGEGCLSVPNVIGTTKRYNLIFVKNGDGKVIKATGIIAVVLQHEIDHFEGILFTDRFPKK